MNAQEASGSTGRCASCEALGHISMNCDTLKPVRVRCSIVPQAGNKIYKLKIKLRHVVTTNKDQEGPILDPGASMHQHTSCHKSWNQAL